MSPPAQPPPVQAVPSLRPGARWGLAVTSGVLLCLPGLEPSFFILAWIGFIPLFFALQGVSLRQAYVLGMLCGTILWTGMSYWMIDFIHIFKNYSYPQSALLATLFWLYAGQSLGLAALVWQWLARVRLPLVLVIPIVFVVVFSSHPVVFNFRLAESQSHFLLALQGTDLIGAHGLDLVMLAVNVLVFKLCRSTLRRQCEWRALGGLAILLALWFGYGFLRLQAWEEISSEASTTRVGFLQPNDAVSIEITKPPAGYSRESPPEMVASERLVQAGAEILFWPEARFKGYFYHQSVRQAFRQRIAAMGVPLVFHDVELEHQDGARRYYNAAVVLSGEGELEGTYRKIRRMPFGEYMPAILSTPLLHDYLGEFLREISPGTSHGVFSLGGMRVVPKICYESSDPVQIADAIGADGLGKILVVLSQDGWFGRGLQPFQHLYSSVLRAVENRVPLVHVINNGPSGVILPSGRMLYEGSAFEPVEAVVDLPYDPERGGSFYSRYPQLVGWVSLLLLGLLILYRLFARQMQKRIEALPRPMA